MNELGVVGGAGFGENDTSCEILSVNVCCVT